VDRFSYPAWMLTTDFGTIEVIMVTAFPPFLGGFLTTHFLDIIPKSYISDHHWKILVGNTSAGMKFCRSLFSPIIGDFAFHESSYFGYIFLPRANS
jgi:hypothetical protein